MRQELAKLGRAAMALMGLLLVASCSPEPQEFDRADASAAQGAGRPSYPASMPDTIGPGASPMAIPPSRVVKVGLLIPLSGRSQAVGEALRDAAVLALFDKYAALPPELHGVRLELVPADDKGTPEGARQAAVEVMKAGAELIIGPLFSASVEAVKPLGKTGKISILSLSNNADVAGDNTYVLGFDPAQQTDRVMRYAFMRNVGQLAILAPNDAYGRQVSKAAEEAADLLGRETAPIIRYTPGTVEQDMEELLREGSDGAKLAFQGLFLPEGGELLGPILSGLAQRNINPATTQFIGTGLWDDQAITRMHNLEGALFASSPPDYYRAYEQRFMATYEYKPPRVASLAYDAVALAATLATTGSDFSPASLTNPNGFAGPANGIFRLRPDGRVDRGLAVLQVRGQELLTVDPAPAMFSQ